MSNEKRRLETCKIEGFKSALEAMKGRPPKSTREMAKTVGFAGMMGMASFARCIKKTSSFPPKK